MNDPIEIPSKGQPMKAGWGASVANAVNRLTVSVPANMLVRYGAGGFGFATLPPNLRDRRGTSAAFIHPWKVKGCAKGENCDHLFEIYIPEGALHVGEDSIEVEGVTGSVIDDEPTGDATFYLVIYRNSESSADDGEAPKAKIVTTVSDADGKIFAVLPIATVTVEEVGNGDNATTRGVVTAQHLTTSVGLPAGDRELGDCVTSLNDGTGDMDIIGGEHITVSVAENGRTIKVSYAEEKDEEDPDPNDPENEEGDPCDHPGSTELKGGSGGGGVTGFDEESRWGGEGGCNNCGGASTVGSDTGTPESGSSGKEVSQGGSMPGTETAPSAPNGKEVTAPPSTSGSSSDSGSSVSSSGKEIAPGSIEATQAKAKSPIYTGSHTPLTDAKKMNESPFAKTAKKLGEGATTPIYTGTKKQLYSGTHAQLTDTKKMNKSPFAK